MTAITKQESKSALWEAVRILAIIFFLFLVAFLLKTCDFAMTAGFAPKYEAVRRKTFEQSQSYNEGMVRDLESIRNDYLREKDPDAKSALRATFIHRAEGYPNQLPADLQSFYQQLESN